jgi:hypothetical protein
MKQPQYETPPLGGLLLGVIWAGAGFEAPPELVFVDDEPQAVKPAATARPRAAPNINFRAAKRFSPMNILPMTGLHPGVERYIRKEPPNGLLS